MTFEVSFISGEFRWTLNKKAMMQGVHSGSCGLYNCKEMCLYQHRNSTVAITLGGLYQLM